MDVSVESKVFGIGVESYTVGSNEFYLSYAMKNNILIIGSRNMEKALLRALLTPWDLLKEAQDSYDHTKTLALQEEIKTLPWQEVWNEYLKKYGYVDDETWYKEIKEYEKEILKERN